MSTRYVWSQNSIQYTNSETELTRRVSGSDYQIYSANGGWYRSSNEAAWYMAESTEYTTNGASFLLTNPEISGPGTSISSNCSVKLDTSGLQEGEYRNYYIAIMQGQPYSNTSYTSLYRLYGRKGNRYGQFPDVLLYTNGELRIENTDNLSIYNAYRTTRMASQGSLVGTVSNAASSTYPLSYIRKGIARNYAILGRVANVA